jgi:hypothetical protein
MERGAILVAAVFEAFIGIFQRRIVDVPNERIDQLEYEAVKAARHILTMCVRALDYCPPVDV